MLIASRAVKSFHPSGPPTPIIANRGNASGGDLARLVPEQRGEVLADIGHRRHTNLMPRTHSGLSACLSLHFKQRRHGFDAKMLVLGVPQIFINAEGLLGRAQ